MNGREGKQESHQALGSPKTAGEADPGTASPRVKQGCATYTAGAVLAFAISVVYSGQALSNRFSIAIELGLFMGIFFFVVIGPSHLILQIIGHSILHRLSRRPSPLGEVIILNLPAVAILALLLVRLALPMNVDKLQAAARKHFGDSIPASMTVKGYERERGLNEGHYTMLFSIAPTELDQLLASHGYRLEKPNLTEEHLSQCKRTAQRLTKQAVSFEPPGALYVFATNIGLKQIRKQIITGSNHVDVLFRESFF